jgi:putative (di)nucleoside polyphosphate hydrolase
MTSSKKAKDLPYRKGVGAVLFNKKGMVFVARRIDMPSNYWQMPQGGIDAGEKPREAVMRELFEETGTNEAEIIAKSAKWYRYDLPDDLVGKVWKGKYRGQKQRWFALRFLGRDSDIDLAASNHPEFSEWKWTKIENLPSVIVPFKRTLYQSLATEFSPLAEDVKKEGKAP